MKKRLILGMSTMLLGSMLLCSGCNSGDKIIKSVGHTIQEKRVSDKAYTDMSGDDKTYWKQNGKNCWILSGSVKDDSIA